MLFNESGEIILQKRASHKRHNANLLDKTIGGHITNGDEPNYTMMVEAVQELGVPSLVTKDYAEFIKTYGLLSAYLKSIALIEYIDTQTFEFKKNFDDEMVVISNRVHFYI
ncbi:MAG: NUDIX domain-containing protein [bacterium]